jgi:hypothetical protein
VRRLVFLSSKEKRKTQQVALSVRTQTKFGCELKNKKEKKIFRNSSTIPRNREVQISAKFPFKNVSKLNAVSELV